MRSGSDSLAKAVSSAAEVENSAVLSYNIMHSRVSVAVAAALGSWLLHSVSIREKTSPPVALLTPQELKRKKCNLKTWSKQSPNTCLERGHNFPGLVQFRGSPGRVCFSTRGSTPLIRMVMQEQNQSRWHFTQSNVVFYTLQHFWSLSETNSRSRSLQMQHNYQRLQTITSKPCSIGHACPTNSN